MKKWIQAFRLRTLPLAMASVGMGSFLAAREGLFEVDIFLLTALTTVLLQILSNLANDYGDSVHGADHAGRKGPLRAVQSGAISRSQMRSAVILFCGLSLISGCALLIRAFPDHYKMALAWLVIGCMCIFAAVTYTAGRKPYGYLGLGDLSVFIFFGLVGVIGSEFMHTGNFDPLHFLPASATGLLAVAVLNVNNVRDIESDRAAGKFSLPVRMGRLAAATYHSVLLYGALLLAILYTLISESNGFSGFFYFRFLFLVVVPFFIGINQAVKETPAENLDPWLKKMALSAFGFMLLFGLGLLLSHPS